MLPKHLIFALIFTLIYIIPNKCTLASTLDFPKSWTKRFCCAATAVSLAVTSHFPVYADSSRVIGEIQTSGLIFKDTLKISGFEDPKISGVTIYLGDFERPLSEKLSKDFFNDPSSSSLTCAQTGPIGQNEVISKMYNIILCCSLLSSLKDMAALRAIKAGAQGEEVFEASRSLFFKVCYFANAGFALYSIYALISNTANSCEPCN
jgi:catabolite regulation protein CreA